MTARRAFELAEWYHRRGSKVVMGVYGFSSFMASDE
jgi:hypothetical protein